MQFYFHIIHRLFHFNKTFSSLLNKDSISFYKTPHSVLIYRRHNSIWKGGFSTNKRAYFIIYDDTYSFFATLVNTIRQHKTNKLQSCSKNPNSDWLSQSHGDNSLMFHVIIKLHGENEYTSCYKSKRNIPFHRFQAVCSQQANLSCPCSHPVPHRMPQAQTLNASQISLNLS